jgi:hypothetical protein
MGRAGLSARPHCKAQGSGKKSARAAAHLVAREGKMSINAALIRDCAAK